MKYVPLFAALVLTAASVSAQNIRIVYYPVTPPAGAPTAQFTITAEISPELMLNVAVDGHDLGDLVPGESIQIMDVPTGRHTLSCQAIVSEYAPEPRAGEVGAPLGPRSQFGFLAEAESQAEFFLIPTVATPEAQSSTYTYPEVQPVTYSY